MAMAETLKSALAIGIGCRRGCRASAIAALVVRASTGLDRAGSSLFTLDAKQHDVNMQDAARVLGLPLVGLPASALREMAPQVTISSARVEAAVGVPSVAEAAALAGAGHGGRLLVPRLAQDGATCAIAVAASAEPDR